MVNNEAATIDVKIYYKENGVDIREILKESIVLLIEKEVKKVCYHTSWLHTVEGIIIIMRPV